MESSLSLEGQNIFVTGVSRSSGIGAAIARKCAQAGANVVTHGNPAYDLNMAYPDATDYYVSDLEKELNDGGYILSALPPSDLSEPAEPERSKEAIRGLCLQAAAALAPLNIRVNCVNPGPTDTGWLTGSAYKDIAKMFPSGRWGTPEDAARLVHFLHSDYAQWIIGQTIASEGGFQR